MPETDMTQTDFIARLPSFTRFADVADPARYTPAPDGWRVYCCDVVNSTQAIEQGRYKAVNMMGAACIMAAVNAAAKTDDRVALAYVFGGDGATILAPDTLAPAIQLAVCGAGAVAAGERRRPRQEPHQRIEIHRHGDRDTDTVLQQEDDHHQNQQDQELLAAARQRPDIRPQTDGREERQQERRLKRHVERDLSVERGTPERQKQSRGQSAHHRLGNTVSLERFDHRYDRPADEQD
jgi:hypothetical protein